MPVRVGDVVTFPSLQIHSLKHGIQVIEFQTHHYERLIVMYAQKVLTQEHWDTKRALELMSREPYSNPEAHKLDEGEGFLEERIVNFPDFTSDRVVLNTGVGRDHLCNDRYHLLIVVSGKAVFKNPTGEKIILNQEQALFVPASVETYRNYNQGSESLIFLRATPELP